jgi:hypothetical protein
MTPWEVKVDGEMAGGGKCWNSIHNYLTDFTRGSMSKARSNVRIKLENVNGNVMARG